MNCECQSTAQDSRKRVSSTNWNVSNGSLTVQMPLQGKGWNTFWFYSTYDPPQFSATNSWECDLSCNCQAKIAGDQNEWPQPQNEILYLLIPFQLLFMNNRYLRQVEKELEQVMNLKREWRSAVTVNFLNKWDSILLQCKMQEKLLNIA